MDTTTFNPVTGAGATTNFDYLQIALFQLAIFVNALLHGLGYALIWIIGLTLPAALGFGAVLIISRMLRSKRQCRCMACLGAVGNFLFQVLFLLYLHAIIDLKQMESFSSAVLLGMSAAGTVVMFGVVILGVGVGVQIKKLHECVMGRDKEGGKEKVEVEADGRKREVEAVESGRAWRC